MCFAGNFDDGLLYTIIGIIAGICVILIVLLIVIFRRKNKYQEGQTGTLPTVIIDNNLWQESLGGKDNIVSVEVKGSRLIVVLKNNELIDKDELHNLGATSIIVSENKVTIVIKTDAENVAKLLK